jgi:hypothetical protein
LWYAIGGFACCFPLAIVGLIKAEEALKIFQRYNLENSDQERAKIAKYIAIFVLVLHVLGVITTIFK